MYDAPSYDNLLISMTNIGIIGWGFVGKATGKGFEKSSDNKIFWYDKFKKSPSTLSEVIEKSEFIFVCVPTPLMKDYSALDLRIVDSVVDEIAPKIGEGKKILIIKSTILPGKTASYQKKYPSVNFAMNPEFLTQRKANEDFLNPSRTIIGSDSKEVGNRIKKLYQTILPKDQQYVLTDTTTAEVAKLMSNLILASKVLLANEFYMLSKHVGADYKTVKKVVELDPRIGTHLGAPGPDGDMGFGGACFPKDMVGLLSFAKNENVDMSALEAIWKKNLKIRKNKDWEKMDNAFGRGASKKK